MQNKHTISIIFLLTSLLIFNIEGLSQKLVTYKAENQPLNTVLSKISSFSKVRFAFDDDYFSKINVSFNFNKLTVDEFLKQLCQKYPLAYKLIGQTWVLFKDEKKIVEKPKPKVVVIKPVPQPVIRKKIEYKKSRLWDLIGSVIDVKSGNQIKFCQLFVNEYTKPITNEFGFFSDEVVGLGDVQIKVNQIGFYPLDTLVMLADGKDIQLKLKPIWKVENSFDDSYSGKYLIDIPDGTDFIAMNPITANYLPGCEVNDFANSLKLLPGIDFLDRNNSGLTTRGSTASENLILLDGVPVFNYSHLFGQVSTLNSKFIHQAFISRGGFGAEYGGGSSGVIELTGKAGQGKTVVDLTAGLLDANLFLGIPINKKISFSGSFRKSIVDYWPNYFYQRLVKAPIHLQSLEPELKDGIVNDPFSNFYDINMKMVFQPNNRNEINFILSNGYDNQKKSFSILSDKNYFMNFQSDWRNYGFGINWKFRSKNLWYNTIVASGNTLYQKNKLESGYKPDEIDPSGFLRSDQDLNNSAELLLKWKSEFSRKKLSHQFGAEYNFYHLKYNYNLHDDQSNEFAELVDDSISNSNNMHLVNLFYQGKYKFNKWIDLNAGIRTIFDLSLAKILIQPRAGIDVIPNDLWKLYYRFGRYIQPYYQTQRIGTGLNSSPVWILPSTSDQYIKSYHHIAGGNFNFKGLLVNIEGYLVKSSGKSAYYAEINSGDNSKREFYKLFTGSEIRQGVDATIQFHHNIYNHSLTYSFSDSKEKWAGINSDQYYPSFTHHRHRLQLNETIAYSGWIATASFKYFTGTPYLLPNSSIKQFNILRLPNYTQLDVSIVRQIYMKSLKIEAGAVLLNVLGTKNEKNIEYFQLGETASNFILKSTSSGILFTPTFFINIKID